MSRRWLIGGGASAELAASMFRGFLGRQPLEIDKRLAAEICPSTANGFRVGSKELPSYRFADLFRAIESHTRSGEAPRIIESQHNEDLNSLLHGKRERWVSRRIARSGSTAWPTGPEAETYLPVDRFWIFKKIDGERRDPVIIRLRYNTLAERAILEVAAEQAAVAEKCLRTIIARSVENSVYRNQILELAFEAGTKDEYGDVERPERLRVLFKAVELVADSDIVIDEAVRQMLRRNVIDLHLRRAVLKANGVPVRRGVLLYGPPGTGKTFACRYVCGKLPETTRIIVTGTALLQVTQIFNLARMLQPSLVILEDVDLVFASRQVNLYSSVLGELLDQMDGLRPYEDVSFILTTNAIDRMEAAIKDRPGRISQCIFFGPPKAELRGRYLLHYLRRYNFVHLNIDGLVQQSEGATQAFLKEWVHRAVQIASERLGESTSAVELRDDDFRYAMDEMRRFTEGSTAKIIGFHSPG
jgi:AAA+ superfamily predicted ATPase